MLIGMMGSFHGTGQASHLVHSGGGSGSVSMGLMIVLALILAIEANGIFGKLGPMASVKGVIHCSIGLTVIFLAIIQFV